MTGISLRSSMCSRSIVGYGFAWEWFVRAFVLGFVCVRTDPFYLPEPLAQGAWSSFSG